MQRRCAFVLITSLLAAIPFSPAQSQSEADLVGTWMLVSVERNNEADEPQRGRSTRGVLILDRVGNVFEYFSTTSRNEPESPQADPQRTLANVGGFWGRYVADHSANRIDFEAEAGVSPSVTGLSFSRAFELDRNRMILTNSDEPQAQGHARFTWQRMPVVEHLTPAYREVVGFWRHIEERRVDTTTGEISNPRQRAPSVIVYTPSGFVGVHFPSQGREPFPTDTPTREEAEAGLRGYLGYFGTLGVFPGEVSHNILSGISPSTGSILRRYADIDGNTLVVTLQGGNPDVQATAVTEVELRRLSNAVDMLPR